jgi:endonuclease/exonuclease/phosphatase family metal-dependent hydrolase
MKKFYAILLFTVFNVTMVLPAFAIGKKDKQQNNITLKILTYNVRNCKGLDNKTDFQRTAEVIKQCKADCVTLQELDSATTRLNKAVALNELALRTGMFATYRGSINLQGGKYGIGILTSGKPVNTDYLALPGKEEQRSLLIVETKNYVICCTHLSLTPQDRITSVQMIAEKLQKYSKPVFLAGDLNSQPNSKEIALLKKDFTILNDPSKPTFPADHPDRCIDYLLAKKNPGQSIKMIASEIVEEPLASDHRPVWVKVKVKR